MGTRRDKSGRLNMDVFRDDDKGEQATSHPFQYTAEWLERVELPPRAHSLTQGRPTGLQTDFPEVCRSAPAFSVRSKQSTSAIARSKLQLQLEQLKKKQELDRETRRLELEMRRRELELEKEQRLAELADQRELQEIEAQLAEAELIEQLENDGDDQYLGSDDENAEIRDAERREAERRDAERRETERRNAERREAERRDAERRETERRNAERREAERRDAERREAEMRDAERREAERRDAERRETERRNAERREAESRDAEMRDAERCEAERRNAERCEAERRDAERREADRQNAERREAERRNAERREVERQDAELREINGPETVRRDVHQGGEQFRANVSDSVRQLQHPRNAEADTVIPQRIPLSQFHLPGQPQNEYRHSRVESREENTVRQIADNTREYVNQQSWSVPSVLTPQGPEGPQPRQTVAESQQMFEHQQALKLMATTIGSTISKGFMMPKREYMTFNGDPLDYPSFTTNFKTNVEDVESDPNVRRNYLIQLCTGKAKEAISGTVMLSPEDGFKKAKSILHEMFGQTHIVAASHIDRVTKGCVIKENESERLMQLARDMENCGMNLNKLGYQSDINSRQNISAVVLRLPRYLRSEWAKEANNLRDQNTEPDFAALTKFVVKKAKLANTEYGRLVNIKVDGERNKLRFQGKPFRRVSVNQTSEEPSRTEQGSRLGGSARMKCVFCSKDGHALEKCYKFQGQSFIERKKFVSVKGLCNLCLAKGHFANKCQKGRGCFIAGCGKRHHPLLHSVEPNEKGQEEEKSGKGKDKERQSIESKNEEVTNAQTGHCGATDMARKQVCLRVIPVKVFSKDNCLEKTTYAIRDEGSNTTLVKESLVKELNLEGRPIDFRLTTMNNGSQESGKSHHLYVQGINQKEILEIPNALSIKNLSVARSCIPTKDDIDKWSHLNGISIPELKNHEVTILIGTDVPEAHWKLEERRGRKKEPYAIRTPLGWSVAGPMGKGRDNDASSFFIHKDDEFLTEMVERMFQLDFSEPPHCEDLAMSLEDKRAQMIMEDSIKVIDGHYQLDLPFREKLPFPNNREMVERRLNSLKARFKKDPDLYAK